MNKNKHYIKYSWYHAFTTVIWCDRCHHSFMLSEMMYKKVKKVDGIQIGYYYCLKCAKELSFLI